MQRGLVLDSERAERATPADGCARFENWVDLYQARVARLAQRLLGWNADVDDVVQDVFLAALDHADTFRGESSPWTWLAAITINRCRNQIRSASLLRRLVLARLFSKQKTAPPADIQAQDSEINERVRQSVAKLPETDREVVVLYYLEQFSAAEIGELLGVTVNVVDVRLHRARARLKTALAGLMKE